MHISGTLSLVCDRPRPSHIHNGRSLEELIHPRAERKGCYIMAHLIVALYHFKFSLQLKNLFTVKKHHHSNLNNYLT